MDHRYYNINCYFRVFTVRRVTRISRWKTPRCVESIDYSHFMVQSVEDEYEGVLHTDHAIREEFFLDREIAPTSTSPYLMDFTYLYDEAQADFVKFSGGQPFSEEQIFMEIGRPEDWTHRSSNAVRSRSDEEAMQVAEQLVACRQWESSERDAD